jgi:hypothetical protein
VDKLLGNRPADLHQRTRAFPAPILSPLVGDSSKPNPQRDILCTNESLANQTSSNPLTYQAFREPL